MTRRHPAEADPLMTIADGITRCICGRPIVEVGTVLDRHWLHVEEPNFSPNLREHEVAPCGGILGVSLALLAFLFLVAFGAGILIGRFTGGVL